MKKILLHLSIVLLWSATSHAQPGNSADPALKSIKPPGDRPVFFGYKPAPFKIHFKERPAGDRRYKSAAALPSVFDLRTEGRVTPARFQGSGNYGGNCTAFATMGSIESRWLSMELPELDLSEQNLAACAGFDEENWGFGQGGNQFTCSAYLTRFDGPVLESEDPYNLVVHFCRDYLTPVALVPESRWLPVRDFDLLKRTIYYQGAVYAGIHWDVTGESFRSADSTYYYSGTEDPNHAILVCGWDDDLETAGGTGAWIVKNSWDTTWADKGFFYISYQDSKFGSDEMAFYPVRWETDEVDTTYMYDKLGFTSTTPAVNTSEAFELVRFTAPSSQLVTHIGVCVPEPETVLDIDVYGSFDGETLSDSMAGRRGIYVEIPGIYTFELPVMVEGDFYVQVSRQVGEDNVIHPIEAYAEDFSDPVLEPDVNWTKRKEGGNWILTVLGNPTLDFNLTIRAYAVKSDAPQAVFMTDKKQACLGSEVRFTYLENHPATGFEWDFGDGASPATADGQGPHTVSYSTEGTKTVSLKVSGPGGVDSVVRYDYLDVLQAIRVNILKETMLFQQGQTVEISAYGADSYEWSPAELVDNASGQTILATPPFAGEHMLYVTGTQGTCTAMDSILLITTNKPPNDDMCDARLMTPGGWIGNFSNEFATPQVGEPAPDEGLQNSDCYVPMKWCPESGVQVQNSLWFYFYGPETGIASIRTSGMDNQIAVYRSDTCTDIGKDDLVAANDDYSPPPQEELAATLDAVTVEPGEKYFLQVDGSYGGAKGIFTLYFYAYPTQSDERMEPFLESSPLTVYPNPGKDVFTLVLIPADSPDIAVEVYKLNGQLIQRKQFRGVPGELHTRLDLGGQPAGIYHLRVIDGDRIFHRKLVRE